VKLDLSKQWRPSEIELVRLRRGQSLTLPQVATTLAVTLVASNTFDSPQQRLIDLRMLHVVLVLMLITATLGPILTQYFAPLMRKDFSVKEAQNP
jgi:hypothetical protein